MADFFDQWLAVENRIVAAKLALTAALHQKHTEPEHLQRLFEQLEDARRVSNEMVRLEIERRRLSRARLSPQP